MNNLYMINSQITLYGQLTAIIAPLLTEALQAATYLPGRPTHT